MPIINQHPHPDEKNKIPSFFGQTTHDKYHYLPTSLLALPIFEASFPTKPLNFTRDSLEKGMFLCQQQIHCFASCLLYSLPDIGKLYHLHHPHENKNSWATATGFPTLSWQFLGYLEEFRRICTSFMFLSMQQKQNYVLQLSTDYLQNYLL